MNEKFMKMAFEYAEMAFKLDEVPVGAVIVKDNEVISYGFNTKEKNCCVMAHAELIAIKKAEEKLDEFEQALNEAQEWAKDVGYVESDVNAIIKETRKSKRL